MVEALNALGVSESETSPMPHTLDNQASTFLRRPSNDHIQPYVWLGATCLRPRTSGRLLTKAALVPISMSQGGLRDVLGAEVIYRDMEPDWNSRVESLVRWGPARRRTHRLRRLPGPIVEQSALPSVAFTTVPPCNAARCDSSVVCSPDCPGRRWTNPAELASMAIRNIDTHRRCRDPPRRYAPCRAEHQGLVGRPYYSLASMAWITGPAVWRPLHCRPCDAMRRPVQSTDGVLGAEALGLERSRHP
ncbi:MAG: transposase [Alphaproteobacteria bacterium]|nr:transposase [Alphaproteobacteria bacterium]